MSGNESLQKVFLNEEEHVATEKTLLEQYSKLRRNSQTAHRHLTPIALCKDVILLEDDTLYSQDWRFLLMQEARLINSTSSSETRPYSTTSLSLVANGLVQPMGKRFPYMVGYDCNILLERKMADD